MAASPPSPPPLHTHLVAGVGAGVVSSLALHPLDLIKVRIQVQDGVVHAKRFTGVASAVRGVWAEEGVRGFYRGASPAAWGAGASWGLYFFFYERAKARLAGEGGARLSAVATAYAAWEAGTFTCLFTNPLWLVKTRMQLQGGGTAARADAPPPYRSVVHALGSIVREDGVRGLYRGLAPALLLTSHGMIQFACYERLKALASAHTAPGAQAAALFGAGLASKAVAVSATYPYQVVKARVQQRFAPGAAREYTGLLDACSKVWAREGLRGFYKGFGANLLRVAPQSALTLSLYEGFAAALQLRGSDGA